MPGTKSRYARKRYGTGTTFNLKFKPQRYVTAAWSPVIITLIISSVYCKYLLAVPFQSISISLTIASVTRMYKFGWLFVPNCVYRKRAYTSVKSKAAYNNQTFDKHSPTNMCMLLSRGVWKIHASWKYCSRIQFLYVVVFLRRNQVVSLAVLSLIFHSSTYIPSGRAIEPKGYVVNHLLELSE